MSDLRKGYDPKFLGGGVEVPMPNVSLELEDDVLDRQELRDGRVADYIHYSIVMSRSSRQAYFSAANLDQSEFKRVSGRRWFIDSRIGGENQIGPEAYSRNVWDRGHLTRRTAITWGDNDYIAKRASNDSCSYANASLQHENFNQDEWRVPEEVVRHFDRDKNDRLCVFTGPVFSETDRWYTRRGMDGAVRIPSGFWKLVAYISKVTDELECQCYVMYQDALFLRDKRGRWDNDIQPVNYQVTVTEVERLTGLEFSQALFDRNPLRFFPRENENIGPEGFATPRSTDARELDNGVAFVRDDIERFGLEAPSRKRELSAAEFEQLINETEEDLAERQATRPGDQAETQ